MDNIINHVKNSIEGVKIIPAVQGAVEIRTKDIAGVFACIADMVREYGEDMYEDLQITTNLTKGIVYIDPIDREEEE